MLLSISQVSKIYRMGATEVHALRNVDVEIDRGEMVAIMGSSGSGKSTLLNILGTLDRPTSGVYTLDGQDVSVLDDRALARFRNRNVGFVFQQFNLLPRYTALANVELPMLYGGAPSHERRRRADRGAGPGRRLEDRMHHQPNELSGGQQQRVSIARSIVQNPVLAAGRRADRRARHRDHRADHGSVPRPARKRHDDRDRDPRAGRRRLLRPHDPLQGRPHRLGRADPGPAGRLGGRARGPGPLRTGVRADGCCCARAAWRSCGSITRTAAWSAGEHLPAAGRRHPGGQPQQRR